MNNKKFTPFSKKNVIYARLEAYIFSLILIVMVWMDKDVSAIAILLSLAWAGYKGLQCFYLWLCKHEHLMDKKKKNKKIVKNLKILMDFYYNKKKYKEENYGIRIKGMFC